MGEMKQKTYSEALKELMKDPKKMKIYSNGLFDGISSRKKSQISYGNQVSIYQPGGYQKSLGDLFRSSSQYKPKKSLKKQIEMYE